MQATENPFDSRISEVKSETDSVTRSSVRTVSLLMCSTAFAVLGPDSSVCKSRKSVPK